MSDPGTHAIEGPAFVISHSARNVVGGATPLVNNYGGVDLAVHATISLLDVPTTFRITVAKVDGRYASIAQVRLYCFRQFSLTASILRKGSAAGGMPISPNAARKTTSSVEHSLTAGLHV